VEHKNKMNKIKKIFIDTLCVSFSGLVLALLVVILPIFLSSGNFSWLLLDYLILIFIGILLAIFMILDHFYALERLYIYGQKNIHGQKEQTEQKIDDRSGISGYRRSAMAIAIILLFGWILFRLIEKTGNLSEDILQNAVSLLAGILATLTGFYFGKKVSS